MTTLADSFRSARAQLPGFVAAFVVLLVLMAVALPNLHRARLATNVPSDQSRQRLFETELATRESYAPAAKAKPAFSPQGSDVRKADVDGRLLPDASAGRKIIRTSSLDMVVQHPADVADQITKLAESLGGYLVGAEDGGQNATTGTLTVRIPAARFDQARAEIRKLGLRVVNEKIQDQDVTRQYVDQDANLRNLKAEEAQYLTILKQAHTVKDMLAVSEKLSEVRGQIEQQQGEFNALSQQVETVSIAIWLRTEAEAEVFGLNWRPLYQIKLALRDGLDSVATYGTAMTAILFYLPAVVLWLGTILVGIVAAWRMVRWAGRRWFGWKAAQPAVQE